MVKCDFEQPGFDFSRDLDFYSDSKEGASPGHATEKSCRKNMRPGEAKGGFLWINPLLLAIHSDFKRCVGF